MKSQPDKPKKIWVQSNLDLNCSWVGLENDFAKYLNTPPTNLPHPTQSNMTKWPAG